MIKKVYPFLFALLAIFYCDKIKSQVCSELDLSLTSEIPSECGEITMTTLHDQNDLPFLYVANKSAGLKIYDISDSSSPELGAEVASSELAGLDVMNLYQDGDFIYLALGNHFTNPQQGGMAIIDVSDPENPVVESTYIVPDSESGAGVIRVENDIAFLGAMKSGVIILDVSNKSNIAFVSKIEPSIDFPVVNPNPD